MKELKIKGLLKQALIAALIGALAGAAGALLCWLLVGGKYCFFFGFLSSFISLKIFLLWNGNLSLIKRKSGDRHKRDCLGTTTKLN